MQRQPAASRWRIAFSSSFLVAVGLAAMIALPGCGSCRRSTAASSAAAKKKKEDEEKKKKKEEDKKRDFDIEPPRVLPHDPAVANYSSVKPGHLVEIRQAMRANKFDFPGELLSSAVDTQSLLLPVPNTAFGVHNSRPAALAKGITKEFDSFCFIPNVLTSDGRSYHAVQVETKIRARGGRELASAYTTTRRMPAYQYWIYALASNPDSYLYLKQLDTSNPPSDEFATEPDKVPIRYYLVATPRVDTAIEVPSHPFAWTSVACVFWDEVNPTLLTNEQQAAMLDWLHWGGQLIVSGPRSLDMLRASFLAPYLPVQPGGALELTQDRFEELNAFWSGKFVRKGKQEEIKLVVPAKPLVGIELNLVESPESQFMLHAGGLVAERSVGRGRVVVTAFSLNDREVINWGAFDGFVHNGLLRRPRREFRQGQDGYSTEMVWSDLPNREREACTATKTRYFSRDLGAALPAAEKRAVPVEASEGEGHRNSVEDQYLGGFESGKETGVGAWNDRSGVALAAGESLTDAAGVTIPNAKFVLRVLGIYLLILVPVNWGIFRALRRVEWAWIAAPCISILGAAAIVREAQLDIGFARSMTEINVVEAFGGYSRAHSTRYTALYTSLSTSYGTNLADPFAVSHPFSSDRVDHRPSESLRAISTSRTNERISTSGFVVDSNTTRTLHTEQMFDLGGTVELRGSDSAGWEVRNDSNLPLSAAGVIRRTAGNEVELAWVGELAKGQNRRLVFAAPEGKKIWFKQWTESHITWGSSAEIEAMVHQYKDGNTNLIDPRKLPPDHPLSTAGPQWDLDGDGLLSRDELARWSRNARAGKVSLGRFFELATRTLRLRPGEYRLLAWSEEVQAGMAILPTPSQVAQNTFVIVQLNPPTLPAVQRDRNFRREMDFREEVDLIGMTFQVSAYGVIVGQVASGGAAERAGIQPGDTIVTVDQKPIRTANELRQLFDSQPEGTTLRLEIRRNENEPNKSIALTLRATDLLPLPPQDN